MQDESWQEEDEYRFRRRRFLLGLLLASSLLLLGMSWNGQALREFSENVRQGVHDSLARQWRDLNNWRKGPVVVGLQIGHEGAGDHPEELAAFRLNTGAVVGDITEVSVNRRVAEAMKETLEAWDIVVELLPATVPVGYRADLVISLHADSSLDPERRGFKSAHFEPARNRLEPLLKAHLDEAYGHLTGLPDDHANVSRNMRRYYAFNHRRYRHAVHRNTPAVIFELGYLSHPEEQRFLLTHLPAEALSAGILNYLQSQGRLEPR